ncbi:MAG TPA: orotate phosphoribosyltransferase [Thermoanaerobaculia bacterium]|nr:orotate phosphoribosyltransferase [Thermoanaerobaculia bacterium]
MFYPRTGFLGLDREPGLERVADRVFEIALPGEHDFDIYGRTLGGETLEQAFEALAGLAEKHGFREPVVLVQYPSWEPLARRLREEFGWRVVYDCMDEHTGFGTHGAGTAEDERRLLTESDLVVVTSRPLLDRVRRVRPDALALPNAADAKRFAELPARSASPLAKHARPVVGYYGAIAAWFDADAVALAARKHPDWSFVLVGDTKGAALESLEGRPNVQLLGEVAYADLTGYVAGFDVCTIPFHRTPLTEATNPVKLYEYLATGKPIVARRLPELDPYADVIALYDTADEFVAALERVVRDPDGETVVAKRRKIAFENTWEIRYETLREALDRLVPKLPANPLSRREPSSEGRPAAVGNAGRRPALSGWGEGGARTVLNCAAMITLKDFEDTGALLKGHFRLSSGLHSDRYLQCARLLMWPERAEHAGRALAHKLKAFGAKAVVSPALGGVVIGHETARGLGLPAMFVERKDGVFSLRRGFALDAGTPVVVVEDVFTTGKSTKEAAAAVEAAGGRVVAVGSIVDRGVPAGAFSVPAMSLLSLSVPSWPESECPLCRQGVPIDAPGSRFAAR